jgi:hypothetical protein
MLGAAGGMARRRTAHFLACSACLQTEFQSAIGAFPALRSWRDFFAIFF